MTAFITGIVACCILIAIPVWIATSNLNYAADMGLAVAWMAAWIVAMCAAEVASHNG